MLMAMRLLNLLAVFVFVSFPNSIVVLADRPLWRDGQPVLEESGKTGGGGLWKKLFGGAKNALMGLFSQKTPQGDRNDAFDLLEGATRNPNVSDQQMDELLQNAIKQIESGDINGAINTYFEVLDANPFRIDANLAVGSILLSLNKPEWAEGFLYTAVRLSRWSEAAAVANLAEALRIGGDPDLAETVVNKGLQALKNKDDSGMLPYAMGILLAAKKEYSQAADWFLSAALLQSTNIEAWLHASTMLFPPEGHDRKFAENVLMQGLETNPKSPELLFRLGTVMHYNGDVDKAIPLYEAALQFDSEYHAVKSTLATAYHSLGRYPDALRMYSEAEKHDSSNVIMLSNFAMLLCTEGVDLIAEGNGLVDRAITIEPNSADAIKARHECARTTKPKDEL